jgi:hypothetical protein
MTSPPDDKRRNVATAPNTKKATTHNKRGRKKIGSGGLFQNSGVVVQGSKTSNGDRNHNVSNGSSNAGYSRNVLKSTILASHEAKQRQSDRQKLIIRTSISLLFVIAWFFWSSRATDMSQYETSTSETEFSPLSMKDNNNYNSVHSKETKTGFNTPPMTLNKNKTEENLSTNNVLMKKGIQSRVASQHSAIEKLHKSFRASIINPITLLLNKIRNFVSKMRPRRKTVPGNDSTR